MISPEGKKRIFKTDCVPLGSPPDPESFFFANVPSLGLANDSCGRDFREVNSGCPNLILIIDCVLLLLPRTIFFNMSSVRRKNSAV